MSAAPGSAAPGAPECRGTLVVHETGHRSCTRQGLCVGPDARHRIVARCGGCEACGRARALSLDDARSLPAQAPLRAVGSC